MMKRFISLTFMLAMTIAMSAQVLQGQWQRLAAADSNEGQTILTIDEGLQLKLVYITEDEYVGVTKVVVTIPGDYTQNDEYLRVDIDTDNISIVLDRSGFNEVFKNILREKPEVNSSFETEMQKVIEETHQGLAKTLGRIIEYAIENLTDTELQLRDMETNSVDHFRRIK